MKKLIVSIFASILLLFISGCQNSPVPPKQPVIDESLPIVSNIKTLAQMSEIGFEWSPSLDPRVQGYNIYRSDPTKDNGKLERIISLKDGYTSHFVDVRLQPNTLYNYRFTSVGEDERESVPSAVISATTSPLLSSVPFIQGVSGLPHRAKIIWRPHPFEKVASYIIERSDLGSSKWEQIAIVNGRLNAEYIDKDLPDARVFRYRVIVKTYDGLLSMPSDIVEAGTKALPKPIENIEASSDLPKKIQLKWSPSASSDVVYYKVYRALNPLLFYNYRAKTKETSFEDLIQEDSKAYYYKITAVDKDGLESFRQENATLGSTLSIPLGVVITSINSDTRSIRIDWQVQDTRAVSFEVIKQFGANKQVLRGINQKNFVDRDVFKDISYRYNIVALDKYGLASKPSEDVVVSVMGE
ncbi:MAG: fibronectin type III domain-containing protein [Sulfurospirillum sp.]|nr:fibronectin type III domain-containing protein [Sulfurospirillum sp.]